MTLELPLPASNSGNRDLVLSKNNIQSFDDDYMVRRLALRLGLHQGFGPSPSIEMIMRDLAHKAREIQILLPMKNPMPVQSWRFVPGRILADTWLLQVDNPAWGNNAEASSSSGHRKPRLELISEEESDQQMAMIESQGDGSSHGLAISYVQPREFPDQSLVLEQISTVLTPDSATRNLPTDEAMELSQACLEEEDTTSNSQHSSEFAQADDDMPMVETTPRCTSKRKTRAKTPIVEDEVRRSSKFRKKGASVKSVSFSSVEDLKSAIVTRSMEVASDASEAVEVVPIEISTLVGLGNEFCGVPPMELNKTTLQPKEDV